MTEIDTGERCEAHVGEVFPPRCAECEQLRREAAERPRTGFLPGTECDLHAGYPLPCARCERDEDTK